MQAIVQMPIEWTKDSVKKYLFGRIAFLLYGKVHTSDLTDEETAVVIRTLEEKLSDWELDIPFPSAED